MKAKRIVTVHSPDNRASGMVSVPREPSIPTLAGLRAMVVADGYRLGASFEDEVTTLAASVETVRGTYGHPVYAAQYNKVTGWLTAGDVAIRVLGR